MAGRNEGCASIGCAGLVLLFLIAMCTGGGPDDPPGGGDRGSSADTVVPYASGRPGEAREWFYIHGTMNVRAAPDPDARVLRQLSRGDHVQLGPRDARGWARLYGGSAEREEYVYRASELVRTTAPAAPEPLSASGSGSTGGRRRSSGGRQLHVGPRGGCYYINSNGNRTYVDRSECY